MAAGGIRQFPASGRCLSRERYCRNDEGHLILPDFDHAKAEAKHLVKESD